MMAIVAGITIYLIAACFVMGAFSVAKGEKMERWDGNK
jgi:hypothetical protein